MCEAGVVVEVAQTLGYPMQLFIVCQSREWRELKRRTSSSLLT